IYPNIYRQPPGTVYDFWNYEADDQGWYVYGIGKVSEDRLHIVPNPGVVIYEFTGAMVGNTGAPPIGPPPGSCCEDGEPFRADAAADGSIRGCHLRARGEPSAG